MFRQSQLTDAYVCESTMAVFVVEGLEGGWHSLSVRAHDNKREITKQERS